MTEAERFIEYLKEQLSKESDPEKRVTIKALLEHFEAVKQAELGERDG